MTVSSDYDDDPDRYRSGMRSMRTHSEDSLYAAVARRLVELGARAVLDVGCAEGALAAALTTGGPRLVGLDMSATMLRHHPNPAVRADGSHLPFVGACFDAVTALNVLYHLPDPLLALREFRRVLRAGGYVLVAAIARSDSPELATHWCRPPTTFDAEEAPDLLRSVFDTVTVHGWDAPLVVLPTAEAITEYLIGRRAPRDVAAAAARDLRSPLTVTKRGLLLVGTA